MSLGLKEYQARKAEEEARREAASKPKVNRLSLEKDGDSVIVRFAQELDHDAKNYNEDRGIGFVNIEHNHPDPKVGWRNRASCSIETQGACLPCEKVANRDVEWADRKGWKQKEKFYINVVAGEPREVKETRNNREYTKYLPTNIDEDTGDGTVYLLEQGTYNGIYNDLANYFLESKISGDTITNKYFKISRKGSGFNDTSYSVLALQDIPKKAKSLDDFELYNIKEDVLVEVPYNQQEAFYYRGIESDYSAPAKGAPVEESEATSTDNDW